MGSAGVAKALIDLGADVNTVVRRVQISKLRGSRVEAEPINYAQIATCHNKLDMVYLFATIPVAPVNLVAALEQAVEQNLPRIVLALLKLGVNWSPRGINTRKSDNLSESHACQIFVAIPISGLWRSPY